MSWNQFALYLCLCLGSVAAAASSARLVEKPFGMGVDEQGFLYVADIEAGCIRVFDQTLKLVDSIDHVEGVGALVRPFDVKPHGERLYVLDAGLNSVLILDRHRRLIRRIGPAQPGAKPGEFSEPHALAIAADGRFFVTDTQNHRIQKFDREGYYLGSIDSVAIGGSFPLSRPSGIAALPDGRWVVSEYGDHPPIIMDEQGNVLKTLEPLGAAYGVAVSADRFAIVGTYSNTVDIYNHAGERLHRLHNAIDSAEPGQFNKPGGLAFLPGGRLVVGEWRNHRLQVFSSDARHLQTVGKYQPEVGREYEAHSRRNPGAPVMLSAFTALLDTATIKRYHEAGIDKLYFQPYENIEGEALRDSVAAAHALGMKADYVFDTFMHGTRPGPNGEISDFARQHPEYFTRKRDGETANRNVLSYAYPEVRQWKVNQVIAGLRSSGADGVVLDYIRWPAGNTDGYDPPALEAFIAQYGEDPRQVDPLDPRWVKLRSGYITQFLDELRAALDEADLDVTVGVYVDADPAMELEAVGRNWPVWSQHGAIDATHHMIYTDNFQTLYDGVRTGVLNTQPQNRVVSCIDVYAGYLPTPEMLAEGVRVSVLAGADEVVIVRDPIGRPGMEDTLRAIAAQIPKWSAASQAYDCRKTDQPIVLDGVLDEPAWCEAQRVERFQLFRPNSNSYALATVGRLAWDESYLYVAFECEDADVRSASQTHDDYLAAGDVVELYIKFDDEHPQYYELVCAPNGTTFDARWPHRGAGDFQKFTPWESGLTCAVKVRGTADQHDDVDEGYTVEMRVPWSAFDGMAGPPIEGTVWTFGLFRYDHSTDLSQPHLLMSLDSAPRHGFHFYEAYAPLRFVGMKTE